MLKACKYCGKIHNTKYICPNKPKLKKNKTYKDNFRSTNAWNKKRTEIKQRDNYLCQICVRNLYNTLNQYTYDNIEVHHVIKLEHDFNQRLDNDNLISLCSYHHHMADSNVISIKELQDIIKQQEGTN